MATTVRRVKQEARLRRSGANGGVYGVQNGSLNGVQNGGLNGYVNGGYSGGPGLGHGHVPATHVTLPRRMPPAEAEGYGPYKPVPPPKPLPASSAQASPPPYRLPPGLSLLPGLSPGLSAGLPGTATDSVDLGQEPLTPSPRLLHTHSSKFPIEREVILSGSDKDSKIPILHEYKKRPKSATAIAPDAPSRSLAWTEEKQAGGGMQHDVELRGHAMAGASHQQAAGQGLGHQPHGLGHGFGAMASSHDALDTMGHVVYKAQPLHVTQDVSQPLGQPRPVSYHPGSTTAHESIYGSTPSAMPRTWTVSDSPTRSRQQIERQQQQQQRQQQQQLQHHQQQQQQQQAAMTPTARQLQQQDMYAITADPSATSTPTGTEATANGAANGVANGAKDSGNKGLSSRTYHSIKDLISSRFGSKGSKEAGDVESALNNLPPNGTAPQPQAGQQQGQQGQQQQQVHQGLQGQQGHPQTPQAATRYNGMDDAGQTTRTPTTPRQRTGRKEDDYQHLPAHLSAQRGLGPGGPAYRTVEEESAYGTAASARYGKAGVPVGVVPAGVPANSPYQRVPMPHAMHPEPIYQRYPQDLNRTPTKQTPTPQQQHQQQQQQQQLRPQQGASNAAVSSPQTLLREHGVYMVMRQPMYGQTKAPQLGQGGEGGAESVYGQTKGPPPAHQDETPKSVTYGGGLYQVVHQQGQNDQSQQQAQQGKRELYQPDGKVERADPNEMYVDQDPYGRTGPALTPAQAQAEQQAAATPAAPQVRRASQRADDDEDDDDEGGFAADGQRVGRGEPASAAQAGPGSGSGSNPSSSSDYDKAGTGPLSRQSQSDSGRGSTVYSSGTRSKASAISGASAQQCLDTSSELPTTPHGQTPGSHSCEWVDMVESELRQILDNSLGNTTGANSTLSESISSMTPPLPPLSPGGSSPGASPRATARYGHSQSLPYGTKPDYSLLEFGSRKGIHGGGLSASTKRVGGQVSASARGWRPGKQLGHKKKEQLQMAAKGGKIPLSAALGLEDGAALDLDSMLDGATNTEENNTSEDDEDMSTTVGDTGDTRAIRKQLEGLEGMYSEVLKLLGVRKQRPAARYQPSDPRVNKRRLYGSLSSLPSSVSSRPVRDLRDRRRHDDRKKVRDLEGINKRFQRLESHVVTLARSVAHLSSEMRTQHLMIREMEHIRSEMASLRTQTNMIAARSQSQSVPRGLNQLLADKDPRKDRLRDPAAITNPSRVKKLTKFFGDEPPLLRIFLKKLGYEKYAGAFETERVGMVELPYLTEERLQKMGIPMGPRLRILQEAQISACRDTVYVV